LGTELGGTSVRYFFFLLAAVIINAGSSFFYKYSSLNTDNRALSLVLLTSGLGLGAVNAVLYTKSLKGIALNTAYPVFSAGSLVLVTAISLLVFHEGFSIQKTFGIGMLVAGVIAVSI
jgi:multidrug transporter EmrE-like cation transporter